jgi:hypothetical protein
MASPLGLTESRDDLENGKRGITWPTGMHSGVFLPLRRRGQTQGKVIKIFSGNCGGLTDFLYSEEATWELHPIRNQAFPHPEDFIHPRFSQAGFCSSRGNYPQTNTAKLWGMT